MTSGIDILHLFPELAAIGQEQLQMYCSEWLRRPIAQEYSLAQITVYDELLLHIIVDASGPILCGDRAFIPIDELLGYIIDRHFQAADKQRELHAIVRDTRRHWAELGRDYEIAVGRMGTLYLTCKNPRCRAELETEQRAREGQEISCKHTPVTCPFCGCTYDYEGRDLQLKVTD
jgi:hypothetical protein